MSKHECGRAGLAGCIGHPRWNVIRADQIVPAEDMPWGAFVPRSLRADWFPTHAEAIRYATSRARAEALAAVQSAEGVTAR